MKVVQYYVANDGATFSDEKTCIKHEKELECKKHKNDVLLYNENKNQLALTTLNLKWCKIIKILSLEGAQFLLNLDEDCILPFSRMEDARTGCWIWFNASWVSIEEIDKIHSVLHGI